METLIRYRVLLGLIWFCTVYLCPTKRTLGICGLIALYEKMPFSMSEKWRKAWCVIFLLGYFFSDNTRLFGIIWASLWEKLFCGGGGGGGCFDKECFKPVSSVKETSLKIEISPAASLHMILSKKQKKKALIRLRGCAGWSAPVLFTNPRRQGFSRRGPYYSCIYDPCNSEWTASHVFFFCFVFLNSHRKFILFCWIVLHFICFTKRCLAN